MLVTSDGQKILTQFFLLLLLSLDAKLNVFFKLVGCNSLACGALPCSPLKVVVVVVVGRQ